MKVAFSIAVVLFLLVIANLSVRSVACHEMEVAGVTSARYASACK